MIEYINLRCNQWAQWVRRKQDSGLGYPNQCTFIGMRGAGSGRAPTFDEAAWEIEQAYHSLEPQLKTLVHEFYLRGGTVDQKARACGCHRDTFYDRLHRAHVGIMEWLNDYAAGIVPTKTSCRPPTVPV